MLNDGSTYFKRNDKKKKFEFNHKIMIMKVQESLPGVRSLIRKPNCVSPGKGLVV
jgi:hypothetical protein